MISRSSRRTTIDAGELIGLGIASFARRGRGGLCQDAKAIWRESAALYRAGVSPEGCCERPAVASHNRAVASWHVVRRVAGDVEVLQAATAQLVLPVATLPILSAQTAAGPYARSGRPAA